MDAAFEIDDGKATQQDPASTAQKRRTSTEQQGAKRAKLDHSQTRPFPPSIHECRPSWMRALLQHSAVPSRLPDPSRAAGPDALTSADWEKHSTLLQEEPKGVGNLKALKGFSQPYQAELRGLREQAEGGLSWEGTADQALYAPRQRRPAPGRVHRTSQHNQSRMSKVAKLQKKGHSGLTHAEHLEFLKLQKRNATSHLSAEQTSRLQSLKEIVSYEQKLYQRHMLQEASQCRVCSSYHSESKQPPPHIHQDLSWILEPVKAFAVGMMQLQERRIDALPALTKSCWSIPMKSTAIRKQLGVTNAESLGFKNCICELGVLHEYRLLTCPPTGPSLQLSMEHPPVTFPESVNTTVPTLRSLAGTEGLFFPALDNNSQCPGIDTTSLAPPEKRRGATVRKDALRAARLSSAPAEPMQKWKKKLGTPPVSEDAVALHLAKQHKIDIVLTPAVLSAMLRKGNDWTIPVIAKQVDNRDPILFFDKPFLKRLSHRQANTRFFKCALLAQGLQTTSQVATFPNTVRPEGSDSAWSPSGDGQSMIAPFSGEGNGRYSHLQYCIVTQGPLRLLVRSKTHGVLKDARVLVKCHMEYHCKKALHIPDDESNHPLEGLDRNDLFSIWASLVLRPPETKLLLGRVNAFTSSVLAWETFTLKAVQNQISEASSTALDGALLRFYFIMSQCKERIKQHGTFTLYPLTTSTLELMGTGGEGESVLKDFRVRRLATPDSNDLRPVGVWRSALRAPCTFYPPSSVSPDEDKCDAVSRFYLQQRDGVVVELR